MRSYLLCRLKSQGFYPKHLRTSLDYSNFFFNNGHFSSQSMEIKLARVHVDSPRQFLHLLFQYHLKCLLLIKQENRWWHKAKTRFFFLSVYLKVRHSNQLSLKKCINIYIYIYILAMPCSRRDWTCQQVPLQWKRGVLPIEPPGSPLTFSFTQ